MKNKKTYKSVKYKSFKAALVQLLENDFSVLGSGKVLYLLADMVSELIERYYPERQAPGKTTLSAISKDAPKGHHRGIKALPQVPVKLDVINETLINKYLDGDRIMQIKRDYVISVFKQAYAQGGVLSCSDVALMLKMSSATISKYVREHMEVSCEIVPTRGFIHDIGPSISHKAIIVGKFLQGAIPDSIARETDHSQKAVDRYIKDYERIRLCIKRNMQIKTISRATGLSKSLVKKYQELYMQYEGDRDVS